MKLTLPKLLQKGIDSDVTSPFILSRKGGYSLEKHFYRSGQFARKASVSVRTLRYYDKEGLLAPSQYSESGYRLYTDADLVKLQQILALKFLGLSLDEIKALSHSSPVPRDLGDMLSQQKAMMHAKRMQLDGIIQAIAETEKLLEDGRCDWDALIRVIQAIQMEQSKDWLKKYFTPEQLGQMQSLSDQSYSDDARKSLVERGAEWTEADQERACAQWASLTGEIVRLADAGADPGSDEAQDVAKHYRDLIAGFTGGDPEIASGLDRFWQSHEAMPEAQKPLPSPYSKEQQEWLDRALTVYGEPR